MQERDYYADLGVSRDASRDEIGRAFRKLAAKYHPDRNPGDKAAEEKFKRAADAYQVLSDPKSREAYDRGGVERVQADTGFRGFERTEDIFSHFGDIFGDLFGRRVWEQETRLGRGMDLEVELPLSFEDAARGGTKSVTLDVPQACDACSGTGGEGGRSGPCPRCQGSGHVSNRARQHRGFFSITTACPDCGGTGSAREAPCRQCGGEGVRIASRTLEVNIPPGIEEGTILRLRGMGAPGSHGGPAGDLHAQVRVARHPVFEREGLNLKCRTVVDLVTATLGGKASVPLLAGQAEMTIPAGTQPGQEFRLRGQGLKDSEGRTGDLLVTVQVEIPRRVSPDQERLLRQFQARSGSTEHKATPA